MTASALSDRLATLLGPRFSQAVAVRVTCQESRAFHGWVLDDLCFDFDGESAPAWFLRPASGRVPAVIYAHAHGNNFALGRDELIEGRGSLQGAYGADLVALGIAALCIEMPGFATRQTPSESARAKAAHWQGETLWGQMLAEQRAGLDFLAEHPQIDEARLGAMGFSMGCTLAWWLAALDPRITATSALCCFADLGELVRQGAHDLHGPYLTVPGLLKAARSGEIAGLIAPRALQVAIGAQDPLTPPEAFKIARTDVTKAYAGAEDALSFHIEPDEGHRETPAMRAAVRDFLRRRLRP